MGGRIGPEAEIFGVFEWVERRNASQPIGFSDEENNRNSFRRAKTFCGSGIRGGGPGREVQDGSRTRVRLWSRRISFGTQWVETMSSGNTACGSESSAGIHSLERK